MQYKPINGRIGTCSGSSIKTLYQSMGREMVYGRNLSGWICKANQRWMRLCNGLDQRLVPSHSEWKWDSTSIKAHGVRWKHWFTRPWFQNLVWPTFGCKVDQNETQPRHVMSPTECIYQVSNWFLKAYWRKVSKLRQIDRKIDGHCHRIIWLFFKQAYTNL